jgi:hypothetical protein
MCMIDRLTCNLAVIDSDIETRRAWPKVSLQNPPLLHQQLPARRGFTVLQVKHGTNSSFWHN